MSGTIFRSNVAASKIICCLILLYLARTDPIDDTLQQIQSLCGTMITTIKTLTVDDICSDNMISTCQTQPCTLQHCTGIWPTPTCRTNIPIENLDCPSQKSGAYMFNESQVNMPFALNYTEVENRTVCSLKSFAQTISANSLYEDYLYFYAGFYSGFFYTYPGISSMDSSGNCKDYDPRIRPWSHIIFGRTKTIVIIIDTSPSMIAQGGYNNLRVSQNLAQAVIQLMGSTKDTVYVLTQSNQYNYKNINNNVLIQMTSDINSINTITNTNHIDQIKQQFNSLINQAYQILNDTDLSNSDVAILVISDGTYVDQSLIDTTNNAKQQYSNVNASIFTYTMCKNSPNPQQPLLCNDQYLRQLACQNYGIARQISSFVNYGQGSISQMITELSALISWFAKNDQTFRYSGMYLDAFENLNVSTISYALYYEGFLVSIVAVDSVWNTLIELAGSEEALNIIIQNKQNQPYIDQVSSQLLEQLRLGSCDNLNNPTFVQEQPSYFPNCTQPVNVAPVCDKGPNPPQTYSLECPCNKNTVLKGWQIALIVIGCALFILIIFLIFKYSFKQQYEKFCPQYCTRKENPGNNQIDDNINKYQVRNSEGINSQNQPGGTQEQQKQQIKNIEIQKSASNLNQDQIEGEIRDIGQEQNIIDQENIPSLPKDESPKEVQKEKSIDQQSVPVIKQEPQPDASPKWIQFKRPGLQQQPINNNPVIDSNNECQIKKVLSQLIIISQNQNQNQNNIENLNMQQLQRRQQLSEQVDQNQLGQLNEFPDLEQQRIQYKQIVKLLQEQQQKLPDNEQDIIFKLN